MRRDEFEKLLDADPYLKKRKSNTKFEDRLFLQEVDFRCPLCGKDLQSRKQRKPAKKLYDIAHIYPNRPTQKQYETLVNLERLGESSEDFENKIALCKDCHSMQDFRTTKQDYLRLVDIKKNLMRKSALEEALKGIDLEKEISEVVQKLMSIKAEELASSLKYSTIPIGKKLSSTKGSEVLLRVKVLNNVLHYYAYIRGLFTDLDGSGQFCFDILAKEVRLGFEKLNLLEKDKLAIFEQMVSWFQKTTNSSSPLACEALVSFFIQNCEVFDEITE